MEDRVLVNNALRPDDVGPAGKRLLLRGWTRARPEGVPDRPTRWPDRARPGGFVTKHPP